MHALDPAQLDVAGRGRAADPGQRLGGSQPGKRLRHRAHHLVGRTTQTCRSGRRLTTRRPWPAERSTTVPVSATATAAAVASAPASATQAQRTCSAGSDAKWGSCRV
jgi:hypothetical protein